MTQSTLCDFFKSPFSLSRNTWHDVDNRSGFTKILDNRSGFTKTLDNRSGFRKALENRSGFRKALENRSGFRESFGDLCKYLLFVDFSGMFCQLIDHCFTLDGIDRHLEKQAVKRKRLEERQAKKKMKSE